MSATARVVAEAKVNLLLRVLAREASGYHAIETVFQRIARLLFERANAIARMTKKPSSAEKRSIDAPILNRTIRPRERCSRKRARSQ